LRRYWKATKTKQHRQSSNKLFRNNISGIHGSSVGVTVIVLFMYYIHVFGYRLELMLSTGTR